MIFKTCVGGSRESGKSLISKLHKKRCKIQYLKSSILIGQRFQMTLLSVNNQRMQFIHNKIAILYSCTLT